jgi:methyl-accepting chemotaxis protein
MKLPSFLPKIGLTGRFISWFLFIALIPLLIISVISLNNTEMTLEKEAIGKMNALTDVTEQSLVLLFDSQKTLLNTIAKNDVFHIDEYDQETIAEMKTDIDSIVTELPEFYELFVLDINGIIIASSDQSNVGKDKSKDDYYLGVIRDKDAYVKDVYQSSSTGEIGYAVSASIIDHYGQTKGFVVGRVKLSEITEVLSHSIESIGETADVFIINSDNQFITKTKDEGESAILNNQYLTKEIDTCLAGQDTNGVTLDYDDVEILGSYKSKNLRKITGKNWCVVAQVDMKQIDAPIIALRNTTFILSLVIVAIILGISLVASSTTSSYIKNPIKKAADLLNKTSTALSASTQQAAAASQQNASIAQQVASGATQQSTQSSKVADIMSQMAAAIQQMNSSAHQVTEASDAASKLAQEAGSFSEQSKGSLVKMKDAIATNTTMVKEVANKSQNIAKIVETITQIAEQTNLLSLNASIEAARAGEAGRGFAVVATEVKELSEEAKKSSGNIAKLIEDMLTNIEATVSSSDDTNKIVDESSQVINGTLEKLQNIAASMIQVSSKIQKVSAVINQQSVAVETVSNNINSVKDLAKQSASGAQQLSASVQQQSAINQQVAAASQQLLSLSTDLQAIVGAKNGVSETEEKVNIETKKSNFVKTVPEAQNVTKYVKPEKATEKTVINTNTKVEDDRQQV